MVKKSPKDTLTHVERVSGGRRNILPTDAEKTWPANHGEILEWYTNEVEDVTRAAQLRLRGATKVMTDYRQGKTNFDETAAAIEAHYDRWRKIFPGEIEGSVRGQSDEEIIKAIDKFRSRPEKGLGGS